MAVDALDRSPEMIAAAAARNAEHVASGKASFQVAELADADLAGARARRRRRRPRAGRPPHLAVQPFGADQVDPTAQRLAENLSAHGFAVDTSAPATATSA